MQPIEPALSGDTREFGQDSCDEGVFDPDELHLPGSEHLNDAMGRDWVEQVDWAVAVRGPAPVGPVGFGHKPPAQKFTLSQ